MSDVKNPGEFPAPKWDLLCYHNEKKKPPKNKHTPDRTHNWWRMHSWSLGKRLASKSQSIPINKY